MRVPFARFALAVCFGLAAFAATAEDKLSRDVAKAMSAANEAMKKDDFATADVHVKEAQAVANRTPYDDYVISSFVGRIALKNNDMKGAENAFKAMSDSPALPEADKANILTNTVLIASNVQDWPAVIKYGEMLQAMGPLPDQVANPLAIAYYSTNDNAKALAIARAQVDAAKAKGQVPGEALLDIVFSAQLQQKDIAGASETLEVLAVNYGNPDDWARLLDIALGTKGLSDQDALNLARLRLATKAPASEGDYSMMGEVTSKLGYSGETVAMLEPGLAAGKFTKSDRAYTYLQTARPKEAQDKAGLAKFDAEARAHKTGDYDVKLAETYFGYGRYAEAEEAARRAIGKGGIKDPQEGPMVLGMALAMQGKNAEAQAELAKVTSGVGAKVAHLWALYTQRKK
jgi:hypothetical protein